MAFSLQAMELVYFCLHFRVPDIHCEKSRQKLMQEHEAETLEKQVFRSFLYIYLHPPAPNTFTLPSLSSSFYFHVTCILPLCLLTLKISFSTVMVHFQFSCAIFSIDTFLCNLCFLIYT